MRDLDQWELFCQLMLLQPLSHEPAEDEALCACSKLLEEQNTSLAVVS